MAKVVIDVGGRRYELSCREGEEDRLRLLGRMVDDRLQQVARMMGRGTEGRELLMTALLLADELDELRGAAVAAAQEEAEQAAAIERCAERLETLAAGLEADAAALSLSTGLEPPGAAH